MLRFERREEFVQELKRATAKILNRGMEVDGMNGDNRRNATLKTSFRVPQSVPQLKNLRSLLVRTPPCEKGAGCRADRNGAA